MEIIVNEWLPEYLRPDADASNTDSADKFVKAWLDRCDKVVIRTNSSFASKFYTYMNKSGGYPACKKRFEVLFHSFLDSERTIKVDECDIKELPDDLAKIVPVDDMYLVELWYANKDRIILTTDSKLKDKLKDVPGLNIYLLVDFLKEYCI